MSEITAKTESLETAPVRTRTATGVALALVVMGAAAITLGLRFDASRVWVDLLVDGYYFLSLALAGLFFLAIKYLASAGWWTAVRRVPEALMSLVPVAALPMLAVWFGRHALYPWTRPGYPRIMATEPALAAKAAYLNEPFFLVRMVLFLGVWSVFAVLLRRASLAQDGQAQDGKHHQHRRMVRLSAGFIVVFAVTFSLASFDWLMSLDPRWTSTLFAVHTFAGLFLAGIAAITLIVVRLRRGGSLAAAVGGSHLHDLGKLLFAFSIFWAYIWVCQYLLIWYGNLSEEIPYYVVRTRGAWLPLFILIPVLNWLVPFLVLLSRAAKRNPRVLGGAAVVVLAGGWLNVYGIVAPAVLPGPRLGVIELLITAGYAGLFFLAATRSLGRAPLLARNDPFLPESLRHHA
ncbi:MAG: hypothetical protein JF614_13065 [Acidobacteria bacterium]|jgi:hypothetical protein|nr:hypothetical protein [Acidobacteriota bacterium]